MRRCLSHVVLIIFCQVLFTKSLYSLHIVGGDATYSFVSFNADSSKVTFDIVFTIYKDNTNINSGQLRINDDFGLYEEVSPGVWEYVDTFIGRSTSLNQIPGKDEPCREEPPASEVGVESRIYTFQATLDVIDNNYMFAFLRCCRNSTVFNMAATEEGAVYDLLITPEAQRLGNNSPTFIEFPPIFICAGFDVDASLACMDVEGDELRYSFCTPLAVGGRITSGANRDDCEVGAFPDLEECVPPYNELQYEASFTASAPMAGNPIVRINPNTGLISGIPETTGQYVVGVCVEEYRNGVLLSRLRRDFQFNALTCIKELSANLEADEVLIDNSTGISRPINVIKACGDSLVYFQGFDVNNTIINYAWNVTDPLGNTLVDTSGRNVRNLEVYFPELGEYKGTLAVEDSEGCKDTAFLNVLRLPDLETKFSYEILDSCYLGPVQFTDESVAEASEVVEWNWNFATEATSDEQSPLYEFQTRGTKQVTLITKDLNTCIDTFVDVVKYEPPHDSLLISPLELNRCFGDSVQFFGNWIKTAGFYEETVVSESSGCDSLYSTLDLNIYDKPRPTTVDTIICPGEVIDYYGVIYSEEQLLATGQNEFQHSTLSVTTDCDSLIHYIRSIAGIYKEVIWSPSIGLDCIDCPYPTVNSEIDTTYLIKLITPENCIVEDSVSVNFVVVPEKYYVPTAVSSSSQNKDDGYLYLMTQDNAYETVTYDLQVFDRWGGLLFDGKDLNINESTKGWSIKTSLPGSYVYKFDIHEYFEDKQLVGTVTIIE